MTRQYRTISADDVYTLVVSKQYFIGINAYVDYQFPKSTDYSDRVFHTRNYSNIILLHPLVSVGVP